jgi:hypothetical protein
LKRDGRDTADLVSVDCIVRDVIATEDRNNIETGKFDQKTLALRAEFDPFAGVGTFGLGE